MLLALELDSTKLGTLIGKETYLKAMRCLVHAVLLEVLDHELVEELELHFVVGGRVAWLRRLRLVRGVWVGPGV